jgi:hypothetical protein
MPMLSAKSSKPLPPTCGREGVCASEGVGVVSMVIRETTRVSEGITLCVRGAVWWLVFRLAKATPVARAGSSVFH